MGHCQWELYIKNGDAMFQGIMRIAQGIWINNGEYIYNDVNNGNSPGNYIFPLDSNTF